MACQPRIILARKLGSAMLVSDSLVGLTPKTSLSEPEKTPWGEGVGEISGVVDRRSLVVGGVVVGVGSAVVKAMADEVGEGVGVGEGEGEGEGDNLVSPVLISSGLVLLQSLV